MAGCAEHADKSMAVRRIIPKTAQPNKLIKAYFFRRNLANMKISFLSNFFWLTDRREFQPDRPAER